MSTVIETHTLESNACPALHSNAASPPLSPTISELKTAPRTHGDEPISPFLGYCVTFPDGSQWGIEQALSRIKFQRVDAPCEATQVVMAQRLEDPSGKYPSYDEAVIKIKFQVRAHEDAIRSLEIDIEEIKECMESHPDRDNTSSAKAIEEHQALLYKCMHPTSMPNQDNVTEIRALDRFWARGCASTPWLMHFVQTTVYEGIDELALVGGYLVFILMTGLPGERIDYRWFRGLTFEDRENIRRAFKTALLQVWECGIVPRDRALRNILWDEEAQKCFIVDFEDCSIGHEGQARKEWTDDEFRCWGLAESYMCE